MNRPGAEGSSSTGARLLLDLSREVTSTLDLQEVLDKSLAALRKLISFGGGSIQLIEEGSLVLAAADPAPTPEALAVRLPLGTGVGGQIARSGEPVYIPDIWTDPRAHPEGKAKAVSPGVRSYFGVPLILHGEPIGVIQIDSPDLDAFAPEARTLVLAFAPTIAAAVQNAMLFDHELRTIDRLREAERVKADFLAMVSHELRTPLTSVFGFAATLRTHASDLAPEDVADYGTRIERASRRLRRLIDDLLDLSQIEHATLRVQIGRVRVPAILNEIADEGLSTHPMRVIVEPELPDIMADDARLRQVIGNLVDNARKFSPPGSTIEIRSFVREGRVAIAVTDQGRGIPQESLDRVFERFFQVEHGDTRTAGGLGLGLYLVKLLCDRMDAEVEVSSHPGRGSTFTLTFPAAAPSSEHDGTLDDAASV